MPSLESIEESIRHGERIPFQILIALTGNFKDMYFEIRHEERWHRINEHEKRCFKCFLAKEWGLNPNYETNLK